MKIPTSYNKTLKFIEEIKIEEKIKLETVF